MEGLERIKPVIGTTPTKRGGAIYQVPTALSPKKRQSLAIKWLIKVCRSRKGKPMAESITAEIQAARRGEGAAYGKKLELHKLAEANRAYTNLRR